MLLLNGTISFFNLELYCIVLLNSIRSSLISCMHNSLLILTPVVILTPLVKTTPFGRVKILELNLHQKWI